MCWRNAKGNSLCSVIQDEFNEFREKLRQIIQSEECDNNDPDVMLSHTKQLRTSLRSAQNTIAAQNRLIEGIRKVVSSDYSGSDREEIKELLRLYDNGE